MLNSGVQQSFTTPSEDANYPSEVGGRHTSELKKKSEKWGQRMQVDDFRTLDKLSNLSAELREIEDQFGEVHGVEGLEDARERVAASLVGFRQNLFWLGEALVRYRTCLKAERTWRAVLDKIAVALGCCSKSLDRLVENCSRAEKLPRYVLEAMLDSQLDPSFTKHRELVDSLAQDPQPQSKTEAMLRVDRTRAELAKRDRKGKTIRKPAPPGSCEEFARRIVRLFESRYASMPAERRDAEIQFVLEKVVNTLRADVHELRRYSRPDQVRKPEIADEVCTAPTSLTYSPELSCRPANGTGVVQDAA